MTLLCLATQAEKRGTPNATGETSSVRDVALVTVVAPVFGCLNSDSTAQLFAAGLCSRRFVVVDVANDRVLASLDVGHPKLPHDVCVTSDSVTVVACVEGELRTARDSLRERRQDKVGTTAIVAVVPTRASCGAPLVCDGVTAALWLDVDTEGHRRSLCAGIYTKGFRVFLFSYTPREKRESVFLFLFFVFGKDKLREERVFCEEKTKERPIHFVPFAPTARERETLLRFATNSHFAFFCKIRETQTSLSKSLSLSLSLSRECLVAVAQGTPRRSSGLFYETFVFPCKKRRLGRARHVRAPRGCL